jgi:16S rRNA (cytidine1402-2'-O)-methyltransferase
MMQAKSLAKTVPPGLHFIATPIGAARDITLRALDILAAEDTRTLRHLMEIHGVALNGRPLWAYHDHNGEAVRPRILAALAEGKSVAYASEAGTPLVADPGYQLSKAAIAAGHVVLAAPGPSAVLAALTVSGLPSDKFMFVGFPPSTSAARLSFLSEMAQIPATLVFYESPKRLSKLLTDMVSSLGEERRAVVCRELTKKFEETTRGTLGELVAVFDSVAIKGEIVVLVDRDHKAKADPITVETALRSALAQMSVKDAAAMVAESLALPRRDVYQVALNIVKDR